MAKQLHRFSVAPFILKTTYPAAAGVRRGRSRRRLCFQAGSARDSAECRCRRGGRVAAAVNGRETQALPGHQAGANIVRGPLVTTLRE